RRGKAPVPLVDRDVGVVPEPALHPARRKADHIVLTRLRLFHVDADLTADGDAIFAGAMREPGGIGARPQRLGGGTAGIDAGTAEALPFHDGNVHAGPGEAMGQRGTGLTRPDDDRIEGWHAAPPRRFLRARASSST